MQYERDQAEESGWNPELNFVFSANLFESSETALDQGNNFAIVGRFCDTYRFVGPECIPDPVLNERCACVSAGTSLSLVPCPTAT